MERKSKALKCLLSWAAIGTSDLLKQFICHMSVFRPAAQSKPLWINVVGAWMETLSEYITSDIQVQYLLFDKIILLRAGIFFLQKTCNGRTRKQEGSTVSSWWKPQFNQVSWQLPLACQSISLGLQSPFCPLTLGRLLAQMRKLLYPLVFLLMWLKLSMLGVEVEPSCLGCYLFFFLSWI